MNNLFLTGKIGVGKSTILKKILNEVNVSIGGYTTERVIKGYSRSYVAKSLDSGETYLLAKVDSRDWSREVFIESFIEGILSIVDESLKNKELIVLDEIGDMENELTKFTTKIYELLDSEKIVIGVLKNKECQFIKNIINRKDVKVIEITEENRDYILEDIFTILKPFNLDKE